MPIFQKPNTKKQPNTNPQTKNINIIFNLGMEPNQPLENTKKYNVYVNYYFQDEKTLPLDGHREVFTLNYKLALSILIYTVLFYRTHQRKEDEKENEELER